MITSTCSLSGQQLVALKKAAIDFELEMAKVDQAREAAFIGD